MSIYGTFTVTWRGDATPAIAEGAAVGAMDDVLGLAVTSGQTLALRDTGNMADSIGPGGNQDIEQHWARVEGPMVKGVFGASAPYSIYQEMGPRPGNPKPWRFRPFIAPSAELYFPQFPARMKARMP
jgi:hypothetical protein